MKSGTLSSDDSSKTLIANDDVQANWQRVVRRRSFLRNIGAAGAVAGAAALPAGKLFASNNKRLSKGDAAILRLAAAIEFIEADLWQQYNELGGAVDHNDNPNTGNPAYINALEQLDGDMPQYISDNTDDEISHRDFLNAYLTSKGAQPIDFTQFQTLPPTKAAGALGGGRLTNLQTLTVDTSWYFRYRSTQNPDLGAKFPQLLNIVKQPAIPLQDNNAQSTIQAIANVAGIHFAQSQQPGSSAHPDQYRRRGNRSLLALARQDGQRCRATRGASIGPRHRTHVPGFQRSRQPAQRESFRRRPTGRQPDVSDQSDSARAMPVH